MTPETKSVAAGYIYAFAATAVWSGNFIVARGLNESIPPVCLAFLRWFVAVVFLTPIAIKSVIKEKTQIKKHLPYLCVTSFLGITSFNTLIYFAAKTTTAMNLSLIAITFPIFILIFSRMIYGERLTIKKAVGICVVLIGVVLLITNGDIKALLTITFNIGDLWMLMAAVIFAVYSLFLKAKPDTLSVKALQLSTFALGLVFLFPFFIWEQMITAPADFTPTAVAAILYIGIFASLTAFFLWNKALIAIGPAKAAMIYYTLPLFCGLLAHLLLGEHVRMLHLYCMILIFSGIVITNREKG